MSDQKPALVLHLSSGGEPLLFAIGEEENLRLERELADLVHVGEVHSVQTKDTGRVTINFAHVAVAYLDDLQRKGKVFGLH